MFRFTARTPDVPVAHSTLTLGQILADLAEDRARPAEESLPAARTATNSAHRLDELYNELQVLSQTQESPHPAKEPADSRVRRRGGKKTDTHNTHSHSTGIDSRTSTTKDDIVADESEKDREGAQERRERAKEEKALELCDLLAEQHARLCATTEHAKAPLIMALQEQREDANRLLDGLTRISTR
ncbi:hypothetical protein THASP1DRAFT_28091 [Thamnocephalis sphaerospora]|uniref:Uncharacterized protein n=1 Tax=Thamnocephalis sphaerospora TaxID=78915 RepID=A0A4P9XV24_9FUNG|nr:hypothetical protein THASP1DRAFT_28091 [Thamnocephalis sphaerospora]|eukprot:RKP10114.1 hypothetical protein THASP1DRAFT_28091 [Thamnocephalis sphaerospora]